MSKYIWVVFTCIPGSMLYYDDPLIGFYDNYDEALLEVDSLNDNPEDCQLTEESIENYKIWYDRVSGDTLSIIRYDISDEKELWGVYCSVKYNDIFNKEVTTCSSLEDAKTLAKEMFLSNIEYWEIREDDQHYIYKIKYIDSEEHGEVICHALKLN